MNHDELNEKIDRFTRGIIRRKISQLIEATRNCRDSRTTWPT
ncbi:MAG: hypothetical protein NTW96_25605 [Planctomycetia bacterium]|nr:hypothetical protein [Planctomycetia bacterium]